MNDANATPTVFHAIDNLQRLAELLDRRREQLARAAGLTVAEWRVLERAAGDSFMPSLFAEERESSRPAVSRLLRQLQDKGLLSVRVSPHNGRHREYDLTAAGRAALRRLEKERTRAIRTVWSELPEDEVGAFVRFSETLIERLDRYAREKE